MAKNNESNIIPLVYSIDEVCALLKLDRQVVYAMARAGKFHAIRIGRRWIIPKNSIDKMLKPEEPLLPVTSKVQNA